MKKALPLLALAGAAGVGIYFFSKSKESLKTEASKKPPLEINLFVPENKTEAYQIYSDPANYPLVTISPGYHGLNDEDMEAFEYAVDRFEESAIANRGKTNISYISLPFVPYGPAEPKLDDFLGEHYPGENDKFAAFELSSRKTIDGPKGHIYAFGNASQDDIDGAIEEIVKKVI